MTKPAALTKNHDYLIHPNIRTYPYSVVYSRATKPGSLSPAKNSSMAPPPVDTWLNLSMRPKFSMKHVVSPPPTIEKQSGQTAIASAIACPKPNAEYIISKIAYKIITIADDEIMFARETLARNGFFVEPAGAAAFAGIEKVNISGDVIVLLTGSGLKGL